MTKPHVISEAEGTITVSPAALEQVVQRAAEQTDGVKVRRPRRGLDVEVEDGRVRVTVELSVRYGAVLPVVAEEVQRRIADGLRTMCGLEPGAIDVTVEELTD
jgi:uncharacterized alkaline shock family protein YloU